MKYPLKCQTWKLSDYLIGFWTVPIDSIHSVISLSIYWSDKLVIIFIIIYCDQETTGCIIFSMFFFLN